MKLWEDGYEDRYYEQKFHVPPSDIAFRHQVARDYVEGLAWVLLYYFQGCPSYGWYYPHHYAPFAADFVDIDKMTINFTKVCVRWTLLKPSVANSFRRASHSDRMSSSWVSCQH